MLILTLFWVYLGLFKLRLIDALIFLVILYKVALLIVFVSWMISYTLTFTDGFW